MEDNRNETVDLITPPLCSLELVELQPQTAVPSSNDMMEPTSTLNNTTILSNNANDKWLEYSLKYLQDDCAELESLELVKLQSNKTAFPASSQRTDILINTTNLSKNAKRRQKLANKRLRKSLNKPSYSDNFWPNSRDMENNIADTVNLITPSSCSMKSDEFQSNMTEAMDNRSPESVSALISTPNLSKNAKR